MNIIQRLKRLSEADKDVMTSVSEEHRMTWPHLTITFTGIWFSMWSLVMGFSIGTVLPPMTAISAVLVGFIITGVYGCLTGVIGVKTGLPTPGILERGAGRIGTIVFSIASVVVFCWAFGMQADIAGRTLASATGSKSISLISALLALLMLSTALIGIHGIRRLSWSVVPLFFAIVIVAVFRAVGQYGGISVALQAPIEPQISFWSAVSVAVGAWIGFATYMPDITRFAKNPQDVIKSTMLSFLIGACMPVMGILLAVTVQVEEIGYTFAMLGMAWLGVVATLAAAWTTNDNNSYSGGIVLASLLKIDRRIATVIVGCVGVIWAYFGGGATPVVLKALNLLPSIWGPGGAVMICEYYILSKYGEYDGLSTSGVPGAIAMVAGAIISQFGAGGLWDRIALPAFFLGQLITMVIFYAAIKIEESLKGSIS